MVLDYCITILEVYIDMKVYLYYNLLGNFEEGKRSGEGKE